MVTNASFIPLTPKTQRRPIRRIGRVRSTRSSTGCGFDVYKPKTHRDTALLLLWKGKRGSLFLILVLQCLPGRCGVQIAKVARSRCPPMLYPVPIPPEPGPANRLSPHFSLNWRLLILVLSVLCRCRMSRLPKHCAWSRKTQWVYSSLEFIWVFGRKFPHVEGQIRD